jgi:hypothetical protein
MAEQQPERGEIGDQRAEQREDGVVVEPDAELDQDLRRHDLPDKGEEA